MANDGDRPPAEGRTGSWILLVIVLVLLVLVAGGGRAWRTSSAAGAAVFRMTDGVVEMAAALLGIRTHRRRLPSVGSNLRQIALGMMAYSVESDGAWPLDFKQVQAWSDGELVPKLFRDPRWLSDPDPFVYVRPTRAAKATQPVLLTRPTTDFKKLVVICYADGHIGTVNGRAQWDEARRLAALPKAMVEGIAPEDWTSVPELRP